MEKIHTWSPPPELFQEVLAEVKTYSPIKYVAWSKEGVRLTIKDAETGERSIVEIPNEEEPEQTVQQVKKVISELK